MANNFHGNIKADSTSVSIPFFLQSSTTGAGETGVTGSTSGLKIYYWRIGSSATVVTTTTLGAITSPFSSGAIKEVDATNMPGEYRLDVPNGAWVTGVDWVVITAFTSTSLLYRATFAIEDNYHTAIADRILTRDWTAVSGEAARSALNALRVLRNKHSTSGSNITICEEDDSTTAFTIAITTDAAALPIIAGDPD
jgi:hypothetical protein